MEMLIDRIRQSVPLTVRPAEGNRYGIVCGHRRIHACRRLGMETIPALITELEP